jgi:hypothetical protein
LKNLGALLLGLCLILSACSQPATPNLMQPPVSSEEVHSTGENANHADSTIQVTEQPQPSSQSVQTEHDEYDFVLEFPSDSYPETAIHIYSAIENGHSDVCTIDRDGADERRRQSLKGIDTRASYDRDEWPMAMCAEGGKGASVAYVNSSDNRGAGSWVGHQLSAYEDGEKVLFIVAKPKSLFGKSSSTTPKTDLKLDEDMQTDETIYKNCTEAHEAGVTPLFEGDPGYSKKLDRDGDGVACEL